MVIYLVFAVIVFGGFLSDIFQFGMILDGALGVMAFLSLSGIVTHLSFPAMHKNAWGKGLSGGFVLAVELWLGARTRKRKRLIALALGLIATCLLFSLSRGGWLAAIVGTLTLVALRRQFKLLLRLSMLLLPLIAILWFALPQEDRNYATGLTSDRLNIRARYETIDNASRTFASNPIFGVGVGYRKEVDATNVIMVSLAESGVVGLAAFLLLHLTIFTAMWKLQRQIPRTSALYSPVALAAALPLSRLAHGVVDHYWGRGPLLQAWGSVGMAIATAAYLKRYPIRATISQCELSSPVD